MNKTVLDLANEYDLDEALAEILKLRAALEDICKLAADKNAGFADILERARRDL